ncbi:MAG: hypothetical protein ACYC0C_14050 [Devosia sp.]
MRQRLERSLEVFLTDVFADPPSGRGLHDSKVGASWMDCFRIAGHKSSLASTHRGELIERFRRNVRSQIYDLGEYVRQGPCGKCRAKELGNYGDRGITVELRVTITGDNYGDKLNYGDNYGDRQLR